jgi:hypothetical protein
MMNFFKINVVLILILISNLLFGQDSNLEKTNVLVIDTIVHQFNYCLKYPNEARNNNIEGTILLTFDIDSTCKIVNKKQDVILGFGIEKAIDDGLMRLEKDYRKKLKSKCVSLKDILIPVVFKLK